MHDTCIKIKCITKLYNYLHLYATRSVWRQKGRCSQDFLLFKLPASFSTAVSRASPNQTTCGLSNPPQWHCGKLAFGIRAAEACGSGALCVKWKLLSVHCSCNVYQILENFHSSHKLSVRCTGSYYLPELPHYHQLTMLWASDAYAVSPSRRSPFLCNPMTNYYNHKTSPLDPIINHLDTVCVFTSSSSRIRLMLSPNLQLGLPWDP